MSATVIEIGSLSAAAGQKVSGFIEVPGTAVRLPVVIINGAGAGKTLLVTAGIHGGEYPSIEAAIRFGAELDPAALHGAVIVMSPVSLNAFYARQAFLVPEDGKNLNRVFPGRALGTLSERMAHTLMTQVVPHIHAWLDLHGGDIPEALLPFMGYEAAADPAVTAQSRALALAFGIDMLVKPDHLPGTSISAAAARGIPALLAEAGQVGILDEPNTALLLRGCRNIARHLGILPGAVETVAVREYAHWPWVRAAHQGCWYPQVAVGQMVEAGQVVGLVQDVFGQEIARYTAPAGGVVLLVCAALSINLNDPLIGIAHD
jgi:hypothetical protein